jgi:glycosyltransferase involved in cell wall biosynthesis
MNRRPLRILQVVQGLEIGGAEKLQVTLARFHDPTQIELHLCSFRRIGDGPVARDLGAAGIPLSSLDGSRLGNPAALKRLVRLVRERGIEVLHSHLSTPNILVAAASAVTSRPAVSTLHALSSNNEGRSRANRYLERWALRTGMRRVIAVAPEILSDAKKSLGIDPRRLVLVPNGIDLSAFERLGQERVRACRSDLLRGRNGPLVVAVGTLAPRKAHQLLVDATPHLLSRFPEARVAIVGRDGANGHLVRARIDSLGLQSHVACVGERTHIAEVLAAADLFALPSVIEGLPLALLEAMAARTPVVAAGVAGVRSVVLDQVTGRLVAPGDADELGRAMVESLASPERSRELAAAARLRVEAEHGGDVWARRLTQLYLEVGLGGMSSR